MGGLVTNADKDWIFHSEGNATISTPLSCNKTKLKFWNTIKKKQKRLGQQKCCILIKTKTLCPSVVKTFFESKSMDF